MMKSSPMTDHAAHEHDVNRRLASVWRDSRLGPTVEKLRRHVLRDGDVEIELAHYRVLHALSEHGSMAMRTLANTVGSTQSSVSRSVQRLEERGLVTRTQSSDDLRSFTIALTAHGVEFHDYLMVRAFDVYGDIFAVFSIAERQTLAALMERLLKSADSVLDDRGS